jgi:hypothetical protein
MAKFYNVDINTWVIMRSLLSSDLNTLLFFVVVAIFGLSYILLLVERPHIGRNTPPPLPPAPPRTPHTR